MEFRWRKFETIALGKAKFIVGQNLGFDINIMGCEFLQNGSESQMSSMPILDTCTKLPLPYCATRPCGGLKR
jgi:hypothetical protein